MEDLLDDAPFDITSLSREPEGNQTGGQSARHQHLATFNVDSQSLELQLERVQLKSGLRVWLVSAESVALIPKAHQAISESPFEKILPQELVTTEIFDTPIWRWIALLLMGTALWILVALAVQSDSESR